MMSQMGVEISEITNTQPLINTEGHIHLGHILGMPEYEPCRRLPYMFLLMVEDQADRGQVTYMSRGYWGFRR